MKFGIIQDCDLGAGVSSPARYREMVDEAVQAEQVGFDFYGLSESHFRDKGGTASAPETVFGYLAGRTTSMKLRWVSVIASTFNHPLRTAERLATLDVISRGRAQLALVRSEDREVAAAFGERGGIDQQWSESIDVIRAALVMDPLVHDGELWHIPSTHVVPNAVQEPHPPIYSTAATVEEHQAAGLKGVGLITERTLRAGWDYIEAAISAYRDESPNASPAPGSATQAAALRSSIAHCAESAEQALAEAEQAVGRAVGTDIGSSNGLASLVEGSPELTIGTPDLFIARAQKLVDLGYDEFILRVDGIGHKQHMQTIRLVGEHVIPAMKG